MAAIMERARKSLTIVTQLLPLLLVLFFCWFDPGDIIARQRRAALGAPALVSRTALRLVHNLDPFALYLSKPRPR